mgnify:FL=1|tara:strand:- start:1169 stop:1873 length:705 start_codon:yes stop_codon:yes gene_type:complete
MKNCHFCDKKFHREKNFKKHLVKCSVLNNVNLLNTDELLFDLLKNLLKTNEGLKTRVEKLEKQVIKENKKQEIDILEWLNDNKHTRITLKEFVENMEIDNDTLEYVYINGLLDGIKRVIKKEIIKYKEKDEVEPIASFEKKKDTIYVKVETGWKCLSIVELKDILCKLQRKMMIRFKKENNLDKMTETQMVKYNKRFMKLCDVKLENRVFELKKNIYNTTKKSYKKLVKYDLVF